MCNCPSTTFDHSSVPVGQASSLFAVAQVFNLCAGRTGFQPVCSSTGFQPVCHWLCNSFLARLSRRKGQDDQKSAGGTQ